MVANPVPDSIAQYARLVGPAHDDVLTAMDERAHDEGFPHVGPEVGGWLAMLARLTDAERVFEFGSGFGYSAYWFARELPADGTVVLTEIDADELDDARENLDRGGLADRARFEHGDAIEIVESYDGPFDVVLIDCEKDRYAEAFRKVRDTLAPGGVVVADNAIAGASIDHTDLVASLDGQSVALDDTTRGIAEYIEEVTAEPGSETTLLPLGEGLLVTHRRRQ